MILNWSVFSQTSQDYFNQSVEFFNKKEYNHALGSINNAISKSDSVPEDYYIEKYKILIYLKDIDGCKEVLLKALETYPESVTILNEVVEFRILLNEFKQSSIHLLHLIDISEEHKNTINLIKLASLKFKCKEYNDSRIIVKSILKGEPDNLNALNLLGLILSEQGDHKKALKLFNKILDKNPESFLINIGFIHQKMGKHNLALEFFNKSLKINDQNPYALANKAKSQYHLGYPKLALKGITKSIHLLSTNAYAYKIRGEIYQKLNSPEKACFDFLVAQNLGYNDQYEDSIEDVISPYCELIFGKKD